MNPVLYTIVMSLLWILNLFNGTGLGMAFQTTEHARMIICIVFIVIILFEWTERRFWVDKQEFIIFGGMIFVFIVVPLIKVNEKVGLHYLYVFLLVYILSKLNVYESAIKLTGFIYVIMGMSILYLFDFSSILSGWNGNTIGMIGLYSYLFFLISFYDEKSIKKKLLIITITMIYIYLIEPTDSRSCTWFAIIAALCALSIVPKNIFVKSDRRYYIWLLIPLLIAMIVVNVSNKPYIQQINMWSLQKFQKPIFNGRDELWKEGFGIISDNLLLGTGDFGKNWHNCLITVLVAYGIVGSVLWIMAFQRILIRGREWIEDAVVAGSIITFLLMYIQQSVELGIINEMPNTLPYIVLGVLLGRISYLRNQRNI